MPRYRVPFDLYERQQRAAAKVTHRTKAQELVLELLRAGRAAELPLFAGTWIYMNFGSRGNRSATPPCCVCGWISGRQCDYRLEQAHPSVAAPTCNRWLCDVCTTSPAPDKDLFPQHVQRYKAWLAGRTNSTDGAGPCPA